MLGRPVLQRTFVLVLTVGLCVAGAAAAQHTAQTGAASVAAVSPSDDMAMPADMGAPIAAPAPAAESTSTSGQAQRLSVDTPIDVIASTPQGKAVLERELPGLCERPEYVMFRTMSPAKLAVLSNGRISRAKLNALQAHLVQVSLAPGAVERPRHNLLAEGGTRVKRFSRSVYRRVVSVIEAL